MYQIGSQLGLLEGVTEPIFVVLGNILPQELPKCSPRAPQERPKDAKVTFFKGVGGMSEATKCAAAGRRPAFNGVPDQS